MTRFIIDRGAPFHRLSARRVIAYYAIAPTALASRDVLASWSAGDGPQPTYLIAKLALDRSLQGQDLGAELLWEALDNPGRQPGPPTQSTNPEHQPGPSAQGTPSRPPP